GSALRAGLDPRRDVDAVAAGEPVADLRGDGARPAATRALAHAGDGAARPRAVRALGGAARLRRRLVATAHPRDRADSARERPRLPALVDNATFRTRRAEPPFVVWLGPPAVLPDRSTAAHSRVLVDGAPGEWTSAGLAYYPLWRATAAGRTLETRRGALGDL